MKLFSIEVLVLKLPLQAKLEDSGGNDVRRREVQGRIAVRVQTRHGVRVQGVVNIHPGFERVSLAELKPLCHAVIPKRDAIPAEVLTFHRLRHRRTERVG